jgi:hypothetical protein
VAAIVLKKFDVDLHKIHLEVEKLVQSGPDKVSLGKLPQTPRAKKVIEYSIEESRSLGHNYVGTEHILLGLLRDEETVAAQVLMNLGLRLDDVRSGVLAILHEPHGKQSHADVPEPTTQKGKVDVGSWLLTVATWDGLLPASIILVPTMLSFLFPRNVRPILGGAEGVAVCIGILIRMSVGSRLIASHRCGAAFRRLQFAFLSLGILFLAILDLLWVLIGLGVMKNKVDYIISAIVTAVLASIYLTSMTIAMYPGRRREQGTPSCRDMACR